MSLKNLLQEWCQTNNSALPVYTHINVIAGDWESTVSLPSHPEFAFSACARTKKQADQLAAGLILDQVSQALTVNQATAGYRPIRMLYGGSVLVLIDLENSPNYTKREWTDVRWDGAHIAAFVGKLSSHATKDLSTLYPFVDEWHIVDSGMKDAVDHAISVRAGQWLSQGSDLPDGIHIVSRDRFAVALVDVLRQVIDWDTEIRHAINIDDVFKHLASETNK
jgi:hypothetical protein